MGCQLSLLLLLLSILLLVVGVVVVAAVAAAAAVAVAVLVYCHTHVCGRQVQYTIDISKTSSLEELSKIHVRTYQQKCIYYVCRALLEVWARNMTKQALAYNACLDSMIRLGSKSKDNDGLGQECSNPIANALELLQSLLWFLMEGGVRQMPSLCHILGRTCIMLHWNRYI